jgi:hypothetical protein
VAGGSVGSLDSESLLDDNGDGNDSLLSITEGGNNNPLGGVGDGEPSSPLMLGSPGKEDKFGDEFAGNGFGHTQFSNSGGGMHENRGTTAEALLGTGSTVGMLTMEPPTKMMKDMSEAEALEYKRRQLIEWPEKPPELVTTFMEVPWDRHRKMKLLVQLREAAAKEAAEAEAKAEEEAEARRMAKQSEDGGSGGGGGGEDDPQGEHNPERSDQHGNNDLESLASIASSSQQSAAVGAGGAGGKKRRKGKRKGGGDGDDGGGGGGGLEEPIGPAAAALLAVGPEEEEVGEELEPGQSLENQRIWKLIPKDQDTRPAWLIHFDSGKVDYEFEYQTSKRRTVNFRVPCSYRLLEQLVQDDWRVLVAGSGGGTNLHTGPSRDFRTAPLHEQRIHHFLKVDPKHVLKYAFKMVSETWYPQGEAGVNESKWSKVS